MEEPVRRNHEPQLSVLRELAFRLFVVGAVALIVLVFILILQVLVKNELLFHFAPLIEALQLEICYLVGRVQQVLEHFERPEHAAFIAKYIFLVKNSLT